MKSSWREHQDRNNDNNDSILNKTSWRCDTPPSPTAAARSSQTFRKVRFPIAERDTVKYRESKKNFFSSSSSSSVAPCSAPPAASSSSSSWAALKDNPLPIALAELPPRLEAFIYADQLPQMDVSPPDVYRRPHTTDRSKWGEAPAAGLAGRHGWSAGSSTSVTDATHRAANGVYWGHFDAKGQREGFGAFVRHNGSWYEGEYHQGLAEGRGRRFYAYSGGLYDGEFHHNMKWGRGTYCWSVLGFVQREGDEDDEEENERKKEKEGCWGGGVTSSSLSPAVATSAAASPSSDAQRTHLDVVQYYDGEYESNQPHGFGILVNEYEHYEGFWVCGQRCGFGRLVRLDGSWYEGEWLRDQPHGVGRELDGDGYYFEGPFSYGAPQGMGYQVVRWQSREGNGRTFRK